MAEESDYIIKASKPRTLIELANRQLDKMPEKIIYRFLPEGEEESGVLSFRDLVLRAKKIGALLQTMNMQGERILLLYQPGLEYIAAFWGCLFAGAVAVPAYPPRNNRNLPRLQAIIDDSDAKVALTSESLMAKTQTMFATVEELSGLQVMSTDGELDGYEDQWQPPQINGDSLAFLQYTSGSTGNPKGVMLSHANLLHNLGVIHQGFHMDTDSIGVIWLPPYHDMGLIGGLLEVIYAGAQTIFMPPAAFLQRPIRMLESITKYRGTISGGPNFTYELLLEKTTPEQREHLDLSSWRVAFNGAEPVRYETLQRFQQIFSPYGFSSKTFYPCYGLAEGTLFVSGSEIDKKVAQCRFDKKALEHNQLVESSDLMNSRVLVSSGHFFGDQTVKIVDPETRLECASGELGEIWVKGHSIAKGYWKREEESRSIFQATIADTGEGPFMRTEDRGFLKDGELYIAGRIKDLIIIRGVNHYPQDVERTVETCHPSLREGCGAAFSVDVEDEERLVIAHEVEFRENPDIQQVAAAMRRVVAEEHELQLYGLVLIKPGHIPKTSSGKIQRYAAKQGYLENTLEILNVWHAEATPTAVKPLAATVSAAAPTKKAISKKEMQQWLIEKISAELHIPISQIDITQPFVSYGLDSARATVLAGDLENHLFTKLPPTLVYDYPSIEALAAHLAADVSEQRVERRHSVADPIKGLSQDQVLTKIEELSESEAELLLLQKLESEQGG